MLIGENSYHARSKSSLTTSPTIEQIGSIGRMHLLELTFLLTETILLVLLPFYVEQRHQILGLSALKDLREYTQSKPWTRIAIRKLVRQKFRGSMHLGFHRDSELQSQHYSPAQLISERNLKMTSVNIRTNSR